MTIRPATGISRRAAGLAALVASAALLLTACGPNGSATPDRAQQQQSVNDSQAKDMQQKLDGAESAAAQADSDSTQNN